MPVAFVPFLWTLGDSRYKQNANQVYKAPHSQQRHNSKYMMSYNFDDLGALREQVLGQQTVAAFSIRILTPTRELHRNRP